MNGSGKRLSFYIGHSCHFSQSSVCVPVFHFEACRRFQLSLLATRHSHLALGGWLQSPHNRRPALVVNASFCSGALPALDFNGLQTD